MLFGRILRAATPTANATLRRAGSTSHVSGYALSVAGLVVAVEGDWRGIECEGRARGFLVDALRADLRLAARWQELDAQPQGRPLFDSGGVWRAFDDAGTYVIRCHDGRHPQSPYKEARVFPGSARGEVLLDPRLVSRERAFDPLEFPLDELLFQHLLRSHGGVELHATGAVAPSGRGYLFTGQSGDGKTTTARLWQKAGAAILSDDRIVVTRDDDGWRMHGTPWHGEAELALPTSAPLAGVFVLARGERNALEPMSVARAVAALLARSFPAFHDAHATAQLVQRLEALVEEVPCRLFRFVPDGDAVGYALDHAP